MKINLAMIKKEDNIFGLLFLGHSDTVSICPFFGYSICGKNIPGSVLEIVDLSRSFS